MIISNLVFLRILAILLIVNAHLEGLYPFSSLASGGTLGNSLFYFISGIGLTASFQRNPVTALQWGKKRITKVIIPLLIYIGIINLGNFKGFVHEVLLLVIWHDVKQIASFLPVLWGLYLLFLPINKLTVTGTRNMLIFLMVSAFILFIYRIKMLSVVPSGLPSSDIFFSLNALICFMLGMYIIKKNEGSFSRKNSQIVTIASMAIILFSQGMHHYFLLIDKKYIFMNFYLNFLTVIALYLLTTSINLKGLGKSVPFLQQVALSSLAVFIVHGKLIDIMKETAIQFPYNIVCVYLYSFFFAYSITNLANHVSSYMLSKISPSE